MNMRNYVFVQSVNELRSSNQSLMAEGESRRSHYEQRLGELSGALTDAQDNVSSLQVSTCYNHTAYISVLPTLVGTGWDEPRTP